MLYCVPLYTVFLPWKRNMVDERSYQKFFKSLLHLLEKISRYRHHITFINTYVQMNYIPRGFLLYLNSITIY